MRASPPEAGMMPVRQFMSVVLPAPFGPCTGAPYSQPCLGIVVTGKMPHQEAEQLAARDGNVHALHRPEFRLAPPPKQQRTPASTSGGLVSPPQRVYVTI